jgi:antagonist of KipI
MGIETFYDSLYHVTPQSDRMGLRLEDPTIERRSDADESIISEGLLPGAVQVPGDGKPTLILNESTAGGYAKVAGVISEDISKAAQLKPGDQVRFEPVSIQEAHRLLKEQET